MKVKVTLREKGKSIALLDNVYMHLPGDPTNLRNLEDALDAIKQECNGEANRNGLKLSDCDIFVTHFI